MSDSDAKTAEENAATQGGGGTGRGSDGKGGEAARERPGTGTRREGTGTRGVVLLTGAGGKVGSALVEELGRDYTVVGLDLDPEDCACEAWYADLTDPHSIREALGKVAEKHGRHFVSVVHLAAYFDFTGEEHPLYEALNVEGTRHLVRALHWLDVEQIVYPGTMLVHRPALPGGRIDESAPVEPKWIYPRSKARAEAVIREEAGDIPVVFLHLAGLHSDEGAVPTLTHQIARIYERSPKARFYPGDPAAGQAFLHRDDMARAVRRTIERRAEIPDREVILVGEPETMSYRALQDRIGLLLHGERPWSTAVVPAPYAKAGAWLETKGEPVIPDDFDRGEKPFIRPFMVDMGEDHYALDISRARRLLGWEPERRIADTLPAIVGALRKDPRKWYAANAIAPPPWLEAAEDAGADPEAVRTRHEVELRGEHQRFLWAHFATVALGLWLMAVSPGLGYGTGALLWSDILTGAFVTVTGALSLSWKFWLVRWATAAAGLWLMTAPLVFWEPTAAGYLNGTLVGALVVGFSVLSRPPPGIERSAAEAGPVVPPGWDFSPSSWLQRAPVIALAVVGFFISRHLTAYQLGHIDGVWDPFFQGGPGPKNGTEEITTSWVSEAWPVPDAGLGALTYMLEILTGMIGSIRRWRTMPWLVLLFGLMIIPLGGVSIFFIVIQPILLGTWCTLCLVAAAAMLIQIPYSADEIVATLQFLNRRRKAGAPMLRVLLKGDVDDPEPTADHDDFERPARSLIRDAIVGGVGLPATLALSIAVGVWLLFTRLTLGTEGAMADADHLIGSVAITVAVTALAEPLRPVRLLNVPAGAALVATSLLFGADLVQMGAGVAAGAALMLLALPKGRIAHRWGGLEHRLI